MKYIKPMLLGTQDKVSSDDEWLYEPKFDGFRLLVGNGHSYTRHGTITTSRLPELIFGGDDVLLDGELIAPGEQSPDDFAGAMSRFSGNKKQPIAFVAFDILSYKKKSVIHSPLEERKALLAETIEMIDSSFITTVPYVHAEGEALFDVMKENNMEGVVAKRLGTPYVPGKRSDNWRKIINWSYHEVVVAKVTFNPLTVQFNSVEGDYIGSTTIGFTKEIRKELSSRTPPYIANVKSRGWRSGGKLRLPQIVEIK